MGRHFFFQRAQFLIFFVFLRWGFCRLCVFVSRVWLAWRVAYMAVTIRSVRQPPMYSTHCIPTFCGCASAVSGCSIVWGVGVRRATRGARNASTQRRAFKRVCYKKAPSVYRLVASITLCAVQLATNCDRATASSS